MKKLTAWAVSTVQNFEKCPAAHKYKSILKMKEPPSAAMARGIEIHRKGEYYLKGQIKGVPREYKDFEPEMKQLKKLRAEPEAQWGVTKKWAPSEFFANDVWGRGKVDAFLVRDDTLHIIDFKTGRVYPTHEWQADVYAAFGFALYPDVEHIEIEFWYVDQDGLIKPYQYIPSDLNAIRDDADERATKMLKAKTFLPTPGSHCKYCSYRTDKGGPCDAWKKA